MLHIPAVELPGSVQVFGRALVALLFFAPVARYEQATPLRIIVKQAHAIIFALRGLPRIYYV